MRGKELGQLENHQMVGITPAYAGKSWSFWSRCLRAGDHPRVCGEKKFFTETEVLQKGSPPRMRGKDAVNASKKSILGITPAYAGKRRCGKGRCR